VLRPPSADADSSSPSTGSRAAAEERLPQTYPRTIRSNGLGHSPRRPHHAVLGYSMMRSPVRSGYTRPMATNTREMPAEPEQVWAVLADPKKYGEWVVGAKEVRGSDGNWPAKGARFHHTVGIWPLHLRDHTSVLESDRPHRLLLQAKIRPIGFARIELELSPLAGGGTRVMMVEEPSAPFIARVARRLFDPVIYVRNGEALRRLENVVCQVDG
jgi:uncharacterized protein YndB with AHSA1/START domain